VRNSSGTVTQPKEIGAVPFDAPPSREHQSPLSTEVLAGYAVATSAVALLCALAYGVSVGVPNPTGDTRGCAEVAPDSARLACYDTAAHLAMRPAGRGYAPIAR
jgi:hypothetical protein